jgi:hypothetical protein
MPIAMAIGLLDVSGWSALDVVPGGSVIADGDEATLVVWGIFSAIVQIYDIVSAEGLL